MKKRLKKKADKARREEIHALLDMALDINGISSRKKELTGDLPTAFFEFHGHTAGVSIEIFKNGWDVGVRRDFCEDAYVDRLGRLGIRCLICNAKEYATKEGLLK